MTDEVPAQAAPRRPSTRRWRDERDRRPRQGRSIRIGELAELTGTTPRTIRYYEEIGLLGGTADREQGKHRCYTTADVERLKEIVRLRDLLGLSLEQLVAAGRGRDGASRDPPRVSRDRGSERQR